MALGINDMTRDTLLLEFSQVRATPIEEARVPLSSASCGKTRRAPLSFPLSLLLLFFAKGLIKGDMKMSKGKRERGILSSLRQRLWERGNKLGSMSWQQSVAPGMKMQVPTL